MHKKWLFITLAVLVTFMLAGCSDIVVESWVNPDNSVKLNMVMEMDLGAIATLIPGGGAMGIDQLDAQMTQQIELMKTQNKPNSPDITSFDVKDEKLGPGRHRITISMEGKDFTKTIGESGSVGSGSKVEKLANGNYQITIPMNSAMGSSVPLSDLSSVPPEVTTQLQSINLIWKFHAPTIVSVKGGEKTNATTATMTIPFSKIMTGGGTVEDFIVEFNLTQSAGGIAGDVTNALGGALGDFTTNIPTWAWIAVGVCCCLVLLVVVVVVIVLVTRKKPQQPPPGYPPQQYR